MASKIQIVVKNLSSVVADGDVKSAVPHLQTQVSRDFAKYWGVDAKLSYYTREKAVPDTAWFLGVFDNSDSAGALGYHDLTRAGQPLGKVFAKSTMDDGGLWSVTCSHELLEMLADPNINLCAFDEHARRLYAYEVCDAVEADSLGYAISGLTVSDFVLPGWFEPLHATKSEKFAFKSNVGAPFELLPEGYISYYDLRGGGWQQLNARAAGQKPRKGKPARANARTMSTDALEPSAYAARPAVGSRRERRRLPKSQWLKSRAS